MNRSPIGSACASFDVLATLSYRHQPRWRPFMLSLAVFLCSAFLARADLEITPSWGSTVDNDGDGFVSSFTLVLSVRNSGPNSSSGTIMVRKKVSGGGAVLGDWGFSVSLPSGATQVITIPMTGSPHGYYDYEVEPPPGGIGIPPMPGNGLRNHPEETPAEDVAFSAIRSIDGTCVTIAVTAGSFSAWRVEESLPSALTPSNITGPNGSWNSSTRKITWYGTGGSATMGYCVTGPPGVYHVSGTATGDDTIVVPPATHHPADVNQNWCIEMSEAISYAAGWQQGVNHMAYAIRALYIWQSGPCYHRESGSEPLCWVVDSP